MPFVSFEGIDGSGKSTQAAILATWLSDRAIPVVLTSEPAGGRLGPRVRAILVEAAVSASLSTVEELLLIMAARYDHVRSVIAPAVAEGKWVISDRYLDSTFAFQIFETGIDPKLFRYLADLVGGTTLPDFTFILDTEPSIAIERRTTRDQPATDPAEARRDFERIRRGFLFIARQFPKRCYLIDASREVSEIADTIKSRLIDAKALPRT